MAPGKKKKAENAAEASSGPVSSENRSPKSLKPKHKIAKKKYLNNNIIKINKFKGTPQVEGRKSNKKKKIVSEGYKESTSGEVNDAKKLNTRKMKQKSITNEEHNEKSLQKLKNKEKLGGLQKSKLNRKNKEKRSGLENRQNQMNKEKKGELGKGRREEKKKEKLGGLIFMCSAKTKPDCFRYRVMGVPMSKKDLVLAAKPGLKLFLYDFDLKLMYGIYKASSHGGMKLEPTAFGGAFPVQVRFNVHQDCYPLPESVFKKAIKENYNEKHKFKTELTFQQVKKLIELFQPAEVRSNAPPICPPPMVTIQNREVYEGARESWPCSHRESFARDPYGEVRRHSLLSHENDQHLPHREVPPVEKEEIPRDSFLSEKEYRTYGLRRERHNLTPPPSHIAPTLEPYPTVHLREHLLSHPATIYMDTVPPQGEITHHDPLLLNEKEYRTYGLGAKWELQHPIPTATTAASTLDSYAKYPYYTSHYGASSADPYPPTLRREEIPSGSYSLGGSRETYLTETGHSQRRETYLTETDHLGRRENDDMGRLYSIYASSALSDYNQIHKYQGTRPEPSLAPVSSRYSFAGPSSSYR
uniref:DCD domain-containing protein n=1 Tax=Davidia involucrata TaxID=16924 RepID=A0A5B6Z6W4_DAVIN